MCQRPPIKIPRRRLGGIGETLDDSIELVPDALNPLNKTFRGRAEHRSEASRHIALTLAKSSGQFFRFGLIFVARRANG